MLPQLLLTLVTGPPPKKKLCTVTSADPPVPVLKSILFKYPLYVSAWCWVVRRSSRVGRSPYLLLAIAAYACQVEVPGLVSNPLYKTSRFFGSSHRLGRSKCSVSFFLAAGIENVIVGTQRRYVSKLPWVYLERKHRSIQVSRATDESTHMTDFPK